MYIKLSLCLKGSVLAIVTKFGIGDSIRVPGTASRIEGRERWGRCPDSGRVIVPLPHMLIKGRAPNLDGPSHHWTIREGDETRCLPAYGHGAASFNSGRPASTKMRATGSRESAALPGTVPAAATDRTRVRDQPASPRCEAQTTDFADDLLPSPSSQARSNLLEVPGSRGRGTVSVGRLRCVAVC